MASYFTSLLEVGKLSSPMGDCKTKPTPESRHPRMFCLHQMIDSSLAAAVATAPFDSGYHPQQRRHLIHAQSVSQLIRVQLIFSLFTNLKAKESCNWWLTRSILGFRQQKSDVKYLPMSVANIGMLQEPFRKRKWCLRDFADTQEGLRNHFATTCYLRRVAKMASTLRFPASLSRHISGNFRRKYTLLYKKAAESLRSKRVISQHFGKCFLQLGVIGLQWLQLLVFQLRIAHRLKHWIVDFLSFEMTTFTPKNQCHPIVTRNLRHWQMQNAWLTIQSGILARQPTIGNNQQLLFGSWCVCTKPTSDGSEQSGFMMKPFQLGHHSQEGYVAYGGGDRIDADAYQVSVRLAVNGRYEEVGCGDEFDEYEGWKNGYDDGFSEYECQRDGELVIRL
uniref:Uncharacterized protein n=1 Tax=Vitis vinifera TaxID=29760 RepID=A5C129_VITVI|nr:hypothetical protein VITISV_012109 [Vitis vinifera]